ncbi:MAG TPA: DEAD/DEAH box helicase family protein [Phormidium sp.]
MNQPDQLALDLIPPIPQIIKPKKQIVLHEFQQKAKKEVYTYIKQGQKKILVIALMSFGKTYLAGWMIRDAVSRGRRCLVLLDRQCLVDQTPGDYEDLGLEPAVYQGKKGKGEAIKKASVVIASIQTIETRVRLAKEKGITITVEDLLGYFDVIHVDEAHLVAFREGYAAIQDTYLPRGAIFIGYTGTPWRIRKSEYLGQYFDVSVIGAQPPDLIRAGRVTFGRFFGAGKYFDYTQLDEGKDGDFLDSSVEAQAITSENLETALYNFKKYFVDSQSNKVTRRSLAFCATVKHAKAICEYFVQSGYPCEVLTGTTKSDERKAMYERLKTQKIHIIFSVGALGIGLNLPFVDGILYLKPTKSKALFDQSVCRAARIYPGKVDWICLDFGNNFTSGKKKRFPHPLALQDYSIAQRNTWKFVDMWKECPPDAGGCGEQVSKFARVCPECGFEFFEEPDDEPEPEQEVVELVEVLSLEERAKLKWFRSLRRDAYLKNTDPHDPAKLFRQRYGYDVPIDWFYKACLGNRQNYSHQSLQKIRAYFGLWQRTDYWSWTENQMLLEFGTLQRQREEAEKLKKAEEARAKREEVRQREREEREKRAREWQEYFKNQYKNFRKHKTCEFKWWEILGVEISATFEQTKKAYMNLAKKYHPDLKAYSPDIQDWTDEQVTAKMQEINNAWDLAKKVLGF